MSSSAIKKTKSYDKQEIVLISILTIIAIALRSYYMAQKPLWLDEIYGYQLGQVGLIRIIQNSLYDPNPPLYYLLQWAASGFGLWQSEWALRWPSVLAGCLTVLFTYKLGRHYTDSISAFLGALLIAISPYHIFYSQEARSATLITLLSAITMFFVIKLLASPGRKELWILYGLFTLGGLYANYSFVLITSIQLLYLFLTLERRFHVILFSIILGVFCLPLAYFFLRSIPSVAAHHAQSSTNVWQFVQALLGGEPIRFGFFWGHTWGTIAYIILILPGMWWQRNSKSFRYYVLQVFLPFIIFWVVFVLIIGIRLPLSEAKQFIVTLPAFFVLVCVGIAKWRQLSHPILGNGVLFILYCLIVLISFVSLSRYWQASQSPEGHAIKALSPQLRAEDAVISLHHSLSAALSFYAPEVSFFAAPVFQDDQYMFSQNTIVILGPKHTERDVGYTDIIKASQIWLLTDDRRQSDVETFFLSQCQELSVQQFEPFRVRLLANCSEN